MDTYTNLLQLNIPAGTALMICMAARLQMYIYTTSQFSNAGLPGMLCMYVYKLCVCVGLGSSLSILLMCYIHLYSTFRGRIKGTASAIFVVQHGLHGGARYTAQHVITVTVLAFLTQETRLVRCKVQ